MVAEHLVQRAEQLQTEQAYWEGVRRQTNAQIQERADSELQEADSNRAMYTDNEQEQLRAQMSGALFHLEEISRELQRIEQLREAEAREAAQREEASREQELKEKDSPQGEDALKEQIAKEEREKAEALQKEEQLKAEALEKERQDKEFFEKKEAERLEALAKEEREKQEALEKEQRDKQETQQKDQSELDFLGEQLADINKEWEFVQDEIASEWDYVDRQIHEEMEYNVEQTLETLGEVAFEVVNAIANPVSEREAKAFFEDQKKQLADFMMTEDFQAQSGERKEMWLAERIKEQERAAQEKFDNRPDDYHARADLYDSLGAMHAMAMDMVKREKEIEKLADAKIEDMKQEAEKTKERIENSGREQEAIEAKLKELAEFTKQLEQAAREGAEKAREEMYEKRMEEMRKLEAERAREAAELAAARAAVRAAARDDFSL
jgi:hypothetical protein